MKTLYPILLCIMILCKMQVNAQTDSVKQEVQFKAGVFYNSHLHYYGRTDSLQSSGMFVLAELWFNKNIYVNVAPVFVNNALQKFEYAGTVATVGYQFNDLKKWAGNFYLVKPFYKESSQLVQSLLKAQVAGSVTWQSRIINITGGADAKFSNRVDFGAMAGVDHPFRFIWPDRTVLVINPAGYVYAGSQQFTRTRYEKNNFLFLPGTEQEIKENVKKFNILSCELSMPVILAKDRFQLLLIPAYVLPQNLLVVTDRPDLSEQGKKMFYVTAGVKVKL